MRVLFYLPRAVNKGRLLDVKRKRLQKARPKQVVVNTTSSEPEWMTVPEACMEAHRSKPIIYEWINRGLIESFVSKARPDSTMGIRLIRRKSLRAFLERQFASAQVEEPAVRMPGCKNEVVA
jgi:hypothetical protein